MFGQSFVPGDLVGVGTLTVLEALLSADNALVLAVMVRHLPQNQQKRALLYGLVGAFFFRLVAILLASFVLRLWWLQAVGAVYLLWLPIKHFMHIGSNVGNKAVGAGFWPTVVAVELTDIAFAIDSILAAMTFIDNKSEKLWVVYFGAMIGIILLRFGAGMLVRIMAIYSKLDHVAYILVGWVGFKLTFLAGHTFEKTNPNSSIYVPELPPVVFWAVLLTIAGLGTFWALRNKNEISSDQEKEASIIDNSPALDPTNEIK